jgi:RNA polymerase sigma factor (sigma-70 family)
MDRAAATLETAVVDGNALSARRALGNVRDDADRDDMLDRLARLASGGSWLATELLIEAVDRFGTARRAVRRHLPDEAAVDDLTQEILIVVARSVSSFRAGTRVTAWLDQVARDLAVGHRRGARSTEPSDESGVARLRSRLDTGPAARRLLGELPERYRDAVRLHDIDGMPYAEVAMRLGRNVTTVESHVARGRALLAGLLER